MQDQAIQNTLVEENTSTQAPESFWSDDQPIYVALAGSALAAVASVPVLLAIWGAAPILNLLYVAALLGLLIGMTGLFTAGLILNAIRLVQTMRSRKTAKSDNGLVGKLAFN
ncbi:hypothetical protein [Algisphaera agarilytica]|uniref:Uncharacterized protein n=1 Tax=Algisphaera agarilytica TaxID=1385975 RepID=A0A7X0LJY0_9BACT|nr:hypothetical protein [Algisphaera agarilytica]MBB6429855.1 hypothetical protein [Algisphaera agarilytica]